MEKITKREMFAYIRELANATMFPTDAGIGSAEIVEFCDNEIDLLDKKAIKAKERAATKAKKGDAMTGLVKDTLTNEFQTIPDIAAMVALEDPDATVAKVQYRLGQLVKNGVAEKQEITIPATETSKTRKVMGYRFAQEAEAENE